MSVRCLDAFSRRCFACCSCRTRTSASPKPPIPPLRIRVDCCDRRRNTQLVVCMRRRSMQRRGAAPCGLFGSQHFLSFGRLYPDRHSKEPRVAITSTASKRSSIGRVGRRRRWKCRLADSPSTLCSDRDWFLARRRNAASALHQLVPAAPLERAPPAVDQASTLAEVFARRASVGDFHGENQDHPPAERASRSSCDHQPCRR